MSRTLWSVGHRAALQNPCCRAQERGDSHQGRESAHGRTGRQAGGSGRHSPVRSSVTHVEAAGDGLIEMDQHTWKAGCRDGGLGCGTLSWRHVDGGRSHEEVLALELAHPQRHVSADGCHGPTYLLVPTECRTRGGLSTAGGSERRASA